MIINLENICPQLEKKQDGIWYSKGHEHVFYAEEESNRCFSCEEKSFWFQHRNASIISLVEKFPPLEGGPIFDVGGGNGFVAEQLIKNGFHAVLLDPSCKGAKNAATRGIPDIICASFESAGISNNSLCAVGLFDVLEHVFDEKEFLKKIHASLKKRGNLYLTVPSYSFLWSYEDVVAGHQRRYTLTRLIKLLEEIGFSIDFSTYIFFFLPILILLARTIPYRLHLVNKKRKTSDLRVHSQSQGSVLSRCIKKILSPEIFFIRKDIKILFGGSCLLAARKI